MYINFKQYFNQWNSKKCKNNGQKFKNVSRLCWHSLPNLQLPPFPIRSPTTSTVSRRMSVRVAGCSGWRREARRSAVPGVPLAVCPAPRLINSVTGASAASAAARHGGHCSLCSCQKCSAAACCFVTRCCMCFTLCHVRFKCCQKAC